MEYAPPKLEPSRQRHKYMWDHLLHHLLANQKAGQQITETPAITLPQSTVFLHLSVAESTVATYPTTNSSTNSITNYSWYSPFSCATSAGRQGRAYSVYRQGLEQASKSQSHETFTCTLAICAVGAGKWWVVLFALGYRRGWAENGKGDGHSQHPTYPALTPFLGPHSGDSQLAGEQMSKPWAYSVIMS